MASTVKKAFSRIKKRGDDESGDEGVFADPHLWSRDLQRHAYGDFSVAVAQATGNLKCHSRVEARSDLTFVGVYDGDKGPRCSRFLVRNVHNVLIDKYNEQQGNMSAQVLKDAISETESLFTELVRKTFGGHPTIGGVGSSCLIGVFKGQYFYVLNIGDSRAVKGYYSNKKKMLKGSSVKVRAEQVTKDHNVNVEEERKQMRDEHPDDPDIVRKEKGIWVVRGGITQLSRSLGHASLKHPEFAYGSEPITRPVIRSEADVFNGILSKSDQFLIFASHGFWEHMTNEEAVDTVCRHPHDGIARRLLVKAMKKAGRKQKKGYEVLKGMRLNERSNIHNDMTVAVIFIDYEWLNKESPVYPVSIVGPLSSEPDEPGWTGVVSGTSETSNPGVDTAEQSTFRRREGKEVRDPAADRIEMLTDRRRKNPGPVFKCKD